MPAGVVLAAGAGRRFGRPKALVEHDGELLVERACRVLREGGCSPVFAVLGAAAEQVRATARLPRVRPVDNPGWDTGMGSSLRAGLAAAEASSAEAVVVLPVDMPGITAEAVRRVAAHSAPEALAAASFAGARGHPVLLGRQHWCGIREAAAGDAGAREYLRTRHVTLVDCADCSDGRDVDRPEDLPEAPRRRLDGAPRGCRDSG
ncbi:nucleotidyltransferase family protein [Salinifilum ghardaiensis]